MRAFFAALRTEFKAEISYVSRHHNASAPREASELAASRTPDELSTWASKSSICNSCAAFRAWPTKHGIRLCGTTPRPPFEARKHFTRELKRLVHRKRNAGSYEMTRVVQWSLASKPNPCRKRIGHQTKDVNGLALRVRLGDRLHGRSAEGHDHIELAVGDLPRDGVSVAMSPSALYWRSAIFCPSMKPFSRRVSRAPRDLRRARVERTRGQSRPGEFAEPRVAAGASPKQAGAPLSGQ